jgi:lipid A 3-O-deacylase
VVEVYHPDRVTNTGCGHQNIIRSFYAVAMSNRYTSRLHCLTIFLISLLMNSTLVGAGDEVPDFFTFTFENDLFVGEDNGYTSGIGITFGRGPFKEFNDENLPSWLHRLTRNLYVSTMKNKRRGIAHMFFQRMQTPGDLEKKELIVDDLPYAGLIAWQGTLYAWDDQVTDQFSLYLGAVGPVTLAEETQSLIHDLTHAQEPMGWDNQIENEPVFKIEAQRVWNLYRSNRKGKEIDILGLWGAGIGNLESATKAGLAIRWGTNLQYSFPSFSLQADRQVNPLSLSPNDDFYLFFGVRAGVVFNYILVDGNTFEDSHSVPLEHYQDQVSTGVVWNIGRSAFVFQVSSISSITEISNERDNFGALSFTHRF